MGFYDIEPLSNPTNALVSMKRPLVQSTESRKRPRPASDQMVARAKGKLVAGSHSFLTTTTEMVTRAKGKLVAGSHSPLTTATEMVPRAKGKLIAGSYPPLTITTDDDGMMECPANAYSSLAICPKRFPIPTNYEDIKRIRTHVQYCHP